MYYFFIQELIFNSFDICSANVVVPDTNPVSHDSKLAIVTLLNVFAQNNCYIFGNFSDMSTIFYFCAIFRPEQNDVIKPFFLDFYSSGQDTTLKFCTLIHSKAIAPKKISKWQPLCVFYRPKHDFTFLVCKICKSDNFRISFKVMYLSCTVEYLFKI